MWLRSLAAVIIMKVNTTGKRMTRWRPIRQRRPGRTAPRRGAQSSGTARSNNKTAKSAAGGARSNATAPAGDVAAAQKVLRTVERREKTLRSALKRHKKTLKQLKKSTTAHRGTVKDLKTDLKKIAKSRKSVSAKR